MAKMNSSESPEYHQNFQHVYESLFYETLKSTDNPSWKAHSFRRLAAQQYLAANTNERDESSEAAMLLYKQTVFDYFKVMDEKDHLNGLDNCSRGIQALCSGFRNDSKQWSLKDLSNNSLFQKTENELKSNYNAPMLQDFEKTLDFVLKLEANKTSTLSEQQTTTSSGTRLKAFDSDIQFDNLKTNPNSINNSTHLFFQEKKNTEDLNRMSKPQVSIEKKQEDIFKPKYPLVVERKYEEPSRPKVIPERRSDEAIKPNNPSAFRTAKEQLVVDQRKKNSGGGNNPSTGSSNYTARPKSLGPRRTLNSPFVLPIKDSNKSDDTGDSSNYESKNQGSNDCEKPIDERLKNIEPKMVELIENEIMDSGTPVHWDDIAGLEFAKTTIKEIVVWPMLRPDIFTGLRGPPRGILLFGPPGTGKTLIGKCIASQSKSTFFSISASSLTSKWIGEGEKMVRALFAVARVHQPSVIFIDEIDSLLSQRSDTEHESSRRLKTEFLVQLDGATTSSEDRLLVVGATNRPQELDEAARRRLVKRLYIPLPEFAARKQIIVQLMSAQRHALEDSQINEICHRTDGYSCADMTNLCKEAAYGPIRSISLEDIEYITPDQVPPITRDDFDAALCQVRASVSTQDLALYEDWNSRYGSGAK